MALWILLVALVVGCAAAPQATPIPTPAPNISATVSASVQGTIAALQPSPTITPDLRVTVVALQTTIAALSAMPTAQIVPTDAALRSTPTVQIAPTVTPPTPAENRAEPTQILPEPTVNSTSVSFRVVQVPTTFGVDGETMHCPTIYRVQLSSNAANEIDRITAYCVGSMVFLAQRGLSGNGVVGGNGNIGVSLHAASGTVASAELTLVGACWGCAWGDAAPYFPWVREHYFQQWGSSLSPPGPPNGLKETFLSKNLVSYELIQQNGLETNGVAYASFIGLNFEPPGSIPFANMQVTLPTADHQLASVILNAFIAEWVR